MELVQQQIGLLYSIYVASRSLGWHGNDGDIHGGNPPYNVSLVHRFNVLHHCHPSDLSIRVKSGIVRDHTTNRLATTIGDRSHMTHFKAACIMYRLRVPVVLLNY